MIAPTTRVHNLGTVERIPVGEGRTYRVAGMFVAIFRSRDGDVFATQAFCPHKAGLLADGVTGGGKVMCPLHGYAFDLASGQPAGNTCAALETYPVTLSETGDLLLSLPARRGSERWGLP